MTDVNTEATEVEAVATTRKISAEFGRSISDGNYGSSSAKAWVQGEVPADATVGEVSLSVGDLLTSAKAAVLDELGIEYEADADGILREKFAPKAQPAAVAQATAERVLGASDANTGGVRIMNPADLTKNGPIDQWVLDAAAADGVTALWDNRGKATGNQPKYREAVARGAEGSGHGANGDPKAYFTPR